MRSSILLVLLLLLNFIAVVVNICYGSVCIPFSELGDPKWHYILFESRMPTALTAMLTGWSLGACGLLLQSYFHNPLAGPSILGITSGANLMVAIVTLSLSTAYSFPSLMMMSVNVLAAMIGAFGILVLILLIGRLVRTQSTLLIVGILISYLTSAIITLLGYKASEHGAQSLMLWGMGDFSSVGTTFLPAYTTLILIGILGAFLLVKPLNGWMLGELYARNLGVRPRTFRWHLLFVTGLLSAITTAWCGPISFVGLAMPHAARMIFPTDNHRVLLPATILLGGLCCLLCLRISTLPAGGSILPINALTPIFGVPIILYVLLRR